jgi:hypothetical protein
MHDWKLSPLPIIMLRGWAYHESQHRREISEATRPWRSIVRRGIATIRRVLAPTDKPPSAPRDERAPDVT